MSVVKDAITVPAAWRRVPFGRLVERRSDVGQPWLEPLSVFLGAGVVPRSSRSDNHNELGADLSKYLVVRRGDIVFNKLRTWQGGFGWSRWDGIVSPAYFVCRPTEHVEVRFLDYMLHSRPYLAELLRISKWQPPSQFDTPWDLLKLVSIALPSTDRQRRIADFLDRECARIDALTDLLLAQEADLDGLLASRLEEEVSVLADVVAIGHVSRTIAGAGFPFDFQGDSTGDLPFVKASDLQRAEDGRTIFNAQNWVTRETARLLRAHVVPPCSVLLPKIGAAMLNNTRRIAGVDLVVDNNLTAVVPLDPADSTALFYLLKRVDLRQWSNPGPIPSMSEGDLRRVRLPWGDRESRARLGRVGDHVERTVRPIRLELRAIRDGRQLYREALVTETVTGSLDVAAASDLAMAESLAAVHENQTSEILSR